MRVRAGAHRQVVLACEAEGLVVVGLEEQARVVDLEDVDVREVVVQRRRIRDRVHAVERVRHVDEAALLLDRGDRLGERHAARDLALEEEADHLALALRLHLLAGNHDQVAAAGQLQRLPRATEDVVVGDGDRAETLRLGVLEQIGGVDAAVVRPARVHVQVDGDPRPVGQRLRLRPAPTALCKRGVELLEPARDVGEGLALRRGPRLLLTMCAKDVVLAEPRHLRAHELGLLLAARRSGDGAPGGSCLEEHPVEPAERRREDRDLREDRRARGAGARGAH